jgi:hypothetical protein
MADKEKLTIEITTGHCLGGVGNDVYTGQVLVAPKDLSIADARKKVRMGYARVVPNAPEPESDKKKSGATVVTHQDPAIESRDPDTEAPDAPAPQTNPRIDRRTAGSRRGK